MVGGTSHPGENHPEENNSTRELGKKTTKILLLSTRTRIHLCQPSRQPRSRKSIPPAPRNRIIGKTMMTMTMRTTMPVYFSTQQLCNGNRISGWGLQYYDDTMLQADEEEDNCCQYPLVL
jgi:hypothetical protein